MRARSTSSNKGKTPGLEPGEARQLLEGIEVTTPVGLRDHARIGLRVFARIGAAFAMKVEDVYKQNRGRRVRLRKKRPQGARHALPA